MRALHRWIFGIFLTLIVVAVSTCGSDWDKAKAIKTVNTTAPIDLSGVDWTGLARLVYGRCGE